MIGIIAAGFLQSSGGVYAPPIGAILYYKLNGNSTDFSDSANNGINTSITFQSVTDSNGKSRNCATFNGSTSKIATTSTLALNTSDKVSVSFWFKIPSSVTTLKMLIELSTNSNAANAFYIDINENEGIGKVQFADRDGIFWNQRYTNTALNDDKWHHFVAVSDRSLDGLTQSNLYVDGVLAAQTLSASTRANNTGNYGTYNLYIGQRSGNNFPLLGSISELLIYKRVLTSEEITSIYNE